MEGKEIGKAFIIGLVVFIGLNVLFNILYLANIEALELYFEYIEESPAGIALLLFGSVMSMINLPGLGLTYMFTFDTEMVILGMSFLIPGIIAALVVGIVAKEKYERFIAWMIIALVAFMVILFAGIVDDTLYMGNLEDFLKGLLAVLLINIAFDGFFAIILPEK